MLEVNLVIARNYIENLREEGLSPQASQESVLFRFFEWNGERYKGTQSLIINPNLFSQVQAVLDGHNRPRYQNHIFAFRGLLTCAFDDCMMTAEMKKQR